MSQVSPVEPGLKRILIACIGNIFLAMTALASKWRSA